MTNHRQLMWLTHRCIKRTEYSTEGGTSFILMKLLSGMKVPRWSALLPYHWAHRTSTLETCTSWTSNFRYSAPLTWMGTQRLDLATPLDFPIVSGPNGWGGLLRPYSVCKLWWMFTMDILRKNFTICLKAQTHQTNFRQLAAMKAPCCFASYRLCLGLCERK